MVRKIDFLIIGTPKGGTTALSSFLNQHPDIFFPEKEIPYFSLDEYYEQGEGYLDSHYRDAESEKLLGGVDVTLLFFVHAARRIHAYNPNMKVISVLRNPVDRAYSAYWYARRLGWEPCETFEDALAKEEERSQGSPRERAMRYLPHGQYRKYLQHYIDLFGEKNVRVILNEELKEGPERSVEETLEWLGVDSNIAGINVREQVNKGGMPRFEWLQWFVFSSDFWITRMIRRMSTTGFRDRFKKQLQKINTRRELEYPPMNRGTREKLVNYFESSNQELSCLLDRDLTHWNQ